MAPVVAVIAPGMMGSAVAARLTQHGVVVRTLLAGRSEATLARAEAAGMADASLTQIAEADFILSIVPPGEAVPLAEQLAPALRAVARKPIYVDCNAISPDTVLCIERVVRETGAGFVDGGIIGPPPDPDSRKTRIYLSGPEAASVTVLESHGLSMPVQPGPVGAASAMKIWRRVRHEDVVCRDHQGIYRARGRDDAGGDAGRDSGCADRGNGCQPAGAAKVADDPDAEDAQQGVSLGGRDAGDRGLCRRRSARRGLLPRRG